MKRLPILVVESRPLHRVGQKPGCGGCVMLQDSKCKMSFHLPNETYMTCLSGPDKPWGAHYEWSQHKISVSRNKREGKYHGRRKGNNYRAGKYDYSLEQRELTYDQAYNTMYPPRERQAKHAQWGRGRG